MTGTRSVGRLGAACVVVLLAFAPVWATGVGAQASAEWNIALVGGPATGSGMTIAVVDTGVDPGHVAFGGRVQKGIDLVDDDDDARDEQGHGTHVAGIAAGETIGCGSDAPLAIGVAPQARILPVRVLDADGGGTFDDVNAGIRAAADRGATVINLSLGDAGAELPGITTGWKDDFRAALEYAWNKGSIPVLASGNSANDPLRLLASGYGDNVKAVVVTAVTSDNAKASYANGVDRYAWGIAAPGGDSGHRIGSAWPSQQCRDLHGTSMATPHVAGALAVLRARGLSQQEAVDRVLDTAAPSSSGTGAGLLNLTAALAGTGGGTTSTTATTTSTTTTTTATPTTVTTTTESDDTTTTTAATSTTAKESTTTTAEVETEVEKPPSTKPPADDLASDLTLESDDEDIPGAAAIAATAAVVLVWFGWVAAVRRQLFS